MENFYSYLQWPVFFCQFDIIFWLSPYEAAYFGDDNDDIESLKKCGLGVAVANAIPPVLEIADRITDTNDCGGVAKFIEENIIKQKTESAGRQDPCALCFFSNHSLQLFVIQYFICFFFRNFFHCFTAAFNTAVFAGAIN